MRHLYLPFITVLVTAAVAACAPGPKQPAPGGPVGFAPERSVADSGWRSQDVSITCGTTACPPQVGVLIYATAVRDARGRTTKFNLARCTATLIGTDRLLTNRHCVEATGDGYFILSSGSRRVRRLVFERFAGFDEAGKVIVGPDAAVLTLEQPFEGVAPLATASGVPNYTKLSAFVGNATADRNVFRIDRVNCSVGPDARFPFDVRENPDVLFSFDCRIVRGNSGGPMFAPGQPQVQAIVQAFGNRSLLATNLRCLPLTSAGVAPCVTADQAEITRRQARATRLTSDATAAAL